jgi:hypothetical protein
VGRGYLHPTYIFLARRQGKSTQARFLIVLRRLRVQIRTNTHSNPDPALVAQIVISCGRYLKHQRQQDGPQ